MCHSCCGLICLRRKGIQTSDAAAAATPVAQALPATLQARPALNFLPGRNQGDNSISVPVPRGTNTATPDTRLFESELAPIASSGTPSAEQLNDCCATSPRSRSVQSELASYPVSVTSLDSNSAAAFENATTQPVESEPDPAHLLVPRAAQELPDTASATQLSSHDYSVGWICAVPVEYVAAQAMLDEVHQRPPQTLAHTDVNDYVFGRVGEHNVVVAVLASGGYGTTSATKVAGDMQASFPNIKNGLMVGIGGGSPSPGNDVRLGDIVVSVPGNRRPGVIQYDYGKAVQGRAFETTGALNRPPRILLNAVAGLRTEYDSASGGHRLGEAVDRILESRPHLREHYQRPGPEADHLFKSGVTHDVSCGGDQCLYEEPGHLEQRSERASKGRPEIHYGLIASANRVMKNALVRDELASSQGVLCFEMEAAGLMNDFPCLVVRGICDYSDTHKNKIWQGYAAMVAAAYAKDLLYRLAPIQGPTSKHSEDEAREILEWITPINYGPRQSDFLRRRQPGTGQWLLESGAYRTWVDVERLTLFCPGVPGAGKTILTAAVVNDLCERFQHDASVGIAYLYLSSEQRADQTPDKLLASLAKQLLQGKSPLPSSLRNKYRSRKDKSTDPSASDILETLEGAVRLYARSFIVVDGLDECEKTAFVSRLSEEIFNFQLRAQIGISFFATSRPIPVIEKLFDADLCLRQSVLASNDDIEKFVNGHVDELSGFVTEMPELQSEIVNTIINASGGMFLLAELYLTFLEDKTTPAEIRETLVQFRGEGNAPVESSEDEKREVLSRAYDRVTKRIDSQKRGLQKLARRVLTWVFSARRPLTETELRHALGVRPGTAGLDEQNMQRVEDMVSVCMGLVTVDAESGTVRFIHATVREYFEQQQQAAHAPPTLILDPNQEPTIAAICVSYLSFAAFSEPPAGGFLTQQDLDARREEHPLYEYAATYWGLHARESRSSARTDELILDFLDCEPNVAAASQVLTAAMGLNELVSAPIEAQAPDQSEDSTPERSEDGEAQDAEVEAEVGAKGGVVEVEIPMRLMAAHLIAHLGLERQVSAFLERGRPMDDRDFAGMSPLAWAARGGHEAVVDLLLPSHGVDVEAADKQGRTPLLWAMWFGREAVVERLLGSGRVSPESNLPARPVLRLAWDDSTPVADDVTAVNEFFFWLMLRELDMTFHLTPLAWAAFIGRPSLVQLVVTAMDQSEEQAGGGADFLNARDPKYGRTPLWWAVRHGHRDAAKLLLETNGVDPDAQDNRLQSPLARAAVNGRAHLVELLLRFGGHRVDVNSKDKYGLTPLCSAASYGHESVVRLLLAQPGIELNPRQEGGPAPLLKAAQNGHTGTVEMIVAQDGVSLNPRDGDGCTPLLVAARHGHAGVVRLLLATDGVDVDARDNMGRTPLLAAAENGYQEVVELLSPATLPDIDSSPAGDQGQTHRFQCAADIISPDARKLNRPANRGRGGYADGQRREREQRRGQPLVKRVKDGSTESIEPVFMVRRRRGLCCFL